MKSPNVVNLWTSEKVRSLGWGAEARDADGHLMNTHIPFSSDDERNRYIGESLAEGWTVTLWPGVYT
jgi:hypothetical protein